MDGIHPGYFGQGISSCDWMIKIELTEAESTEDRSPAPELWGLDIIPLMLAPIVKNLGVDSGYLPFDEDPGHHYCQISFLTGSYFPTLGLS